MLGTSQGTGWMWGTSCAPLSWDLALTSCPITIPCPGQGTALLAQTQNTARLSPPGPQMMGKPLAFLSSSSLVRGRVPSALFSSTFPA